MPAKKRCIITDRCRICGLCKAVCPANAIVQDTRHYQIDPEKCVGCGSCLARCPYHAVKEA